MVYRVVVVIVEFNVDGGNVSKVLEGSEVVVIFYCFDFFVLEIIYGLVGVCLVGWFNKGSGCIDNFVEDRRGCDGEVFVFYVDIGVLLRVSIGII